MKELNYAFAWFGGTLLFAVFIIGCGTLGMMPGALIHNQNAMIVGIVIGGVLGFSLAIVSIIAIKKWINR
jgi:hypothetical protein